MAVTRYCAIADFPSFSEGLSLRGRKKAKPWRLSRPFPFLFGGTFIEGILLRRVDVIAPAFPFLFGGTFIEGGPDLTVRRKNQHFPSFSEGLSLRGSMTAGTTSTSFDFPSFSEGLSLRVTIAIPRLRKSSISLPFRRDFH